MHGHDWKRISVPAQTLYTLEGRSVPNPDRKVLDDLYSSGLLATNTYLDALNPAGLARQNTRAWKCLRCGQVIVAHGGMRQRDARKKARIPFDCDMQIVETIHRR